MGNFEFAIGRTEIVSETIAARCSEQNGWDRRVFLWVVAMMIAGKAQDGIGLRRLGGCRRGYEAKGIGAFVAQVGVLHSGD